jgi:PadR family transcriptional regulator PadR
MAESLGEFEQMIMLAVMRLGGQAYGVSIRREIQAITGRNVSAGAVYTTLGRLETREFVESRAGDSIPERTGQRRKYYTLLPHGASSLHKSYSNVKAMAHGIVDELAQLAGKTSVGGAG